MNKQFLNDVKFDKEIKLKRPKKVPTEKQLHKEKEKRRQKRFNKKLTRLVFFLLTVVVICYVSILSCEGFISMAAGRRVTIKEFVGAFFSGD